jgi:putative flippase GtrA
VIRRLTGEFLGYAVASGAALLADVLLLVLLVERLGVHYLLAATTSFLAGSIVSYLLCTRFVFSHRRVSHVPAEFAAFAAIGAAGLAINVGVMYAAVEWLELHYLVARLGAAAFSFLANYAARRLLLFTPWRQPQPVPVQDAQP